MGLRSWLPQLVWPLMIRTAHNCWKMRADIGGYNDKDAGATRQHYYPRGYTSIAASNFSSYGDYHHARSGRRLSLQYSSIVVTALLEFTDRTGLGKITTRIKGTAMPTSSRSSPARAVGHHADCQARRQWTRSACSGTSRTRPVHKV
jgi:hypothetical protein